MSETSKSQGVDYVWTRKKIIDQDSGSDVEEMHLIELLLIELFAVHCAGNRIFKIIIWHAANNEPHDTNSHLIYTVHTAKVFNVHCLLLMIVEIASTSFHVMKNHK